MQIALAIGTGSLQTAPVEFGWTSLKRKDGSYPHKNAPKWTSDFCHRGQVLRCHCAPLRGRSNILTSNGREKPKVSWSLDHGKRQRSNENQGSVMAEHPQLGHRNQVFEER